MSDDAGYEEWLEDLGARPLSPSDLDALLERARQTADARLRLLVKEVQVLRWLLPHLLERVERAGTDAAGEADEFLKVARFLVGRDPG